MADELKTGSEGKDAGNGDQQKIEFTSEQQRYIDDLIGRKYSEAHAKAETKTNETIMGLKQQIAELQAGKGKGSEGKEKEGGEDLSALKERLAAMEQTVKASQERERRATLNSIAAELNAVNAEQVSTLVSPYLRVAEDGIVTVLNSEGKARFNSSGQPMTVKEFVTEFLNGNPHFVKAGGQPGAGSQGAKGPGSGDVKTIKRGDFDKMSPAQKIEFSKSGGKIAD